MELRASQSRTRAPARGQRRHHLLLLRWALYAVVSRFLLCSRWVEERRGECCRISGDAADTGYDPSGSQINSVTELAVE